MELFKEREKKCREVEKLYGKGSPEWIEMHRSFRSRIANSCREDYRKWIESLVQDIRDAEIGGRSSVFGDRYRALLKCPRVPRPPGNSQVGPPPGHKRFKPGPGAFS